MTQWKHSPLLYELVSFVCLLAAVLCMLLLWSVQLHCRGFSVGGIRALTCHVSVFVEHGFTLTCLMMELGDGWQELTVFWLYSTLHPCLLPHTITFSFFPHDSVPALFFLTTLLSLHHSSFSYSPTLPSLLLSSPPSGDTVTACVSQPLPASESCYWRLPYPAEIPVCVCARAYVCKCMSARRWESNWVREGCLSSLRCHRHPFLSSSSAAMELQQAESQQHLQKGLR